MQEIHLHHPYSAKQIPKEDVVLVLGYFDGVHRAHQQVIKKGREIARQEGLKLALMTFNKQPSLVFQKFNSEMLMNLTSPALKRNWMNKLGVDYYYFTDFTSLFASLSPQEFVDQYMVGLNAKIVVVGFDYTYGPKEVANLLLLPKYAKERFVIEIVSEYKVKEKKVSSTWIRKLLSKGDLKEANQMLGYLYVTEGVVVCRDDQGQVLNFSTINIEVDKNIYLPGVGVYLTEVEIIGKKYRATALIRHEYNETFEKDQNLTVRVHIFDFDQQIYGEKVKIYWLNCLYRRKNWKKSAIN
ncbi:MAG: riboflavin biosynthesis protein RibF [Streptococcaceae bacterium]|jgi:riboflavin kinase/FMN adenylyltransferase|nr:riboflavin biosynthesis protein RibF [Streptococcaceae bacterium]